MSQLILINDIFDELKHENEKLSNELTISEKNNEFLVKFKLILSNFCKNCVCSQTIDIKKDFISLENDYKKFFSDLNKISDNLKTKKVISEKNKNKRKKVEKRKFEIKTETDDEFVVENTDEVIDSSEGEKPLISKKENNVKLLNKIHSKGVFCDYEPENRYKVYHKTGSTKPIAYGCDWSECEYIARTEQWILNHIRTKHTFEKPFKCEFCKYKASTDSYLNDHIRYKHTNAAKFKCDINGCEYTSSKLSLLNLHKHRKHNSSPTLMNRFECKFTGCGKVFARLEYLSSHKLIHTNEKPFPCDWPGCESTFKNKRYLNIHRMTHTGEKPYVCQWPECGKRFRMSAHLHKHECQHTGERKYGCLWPGCDHRFTSNFNRKLHLKTHQKHAALEYKNSNQSNSNNNVIDFDFSSI